MYTVAGMDLADPSPGPPGIQVIGSPGSGKSTYCHGLAQFFNALERPIHIVNLDPANDNIPYECALDITELISLQDVQEEFGLGPNGGMVYCLEYLEKEFTWLEEGLKGLDPDYVVFDMPGQVELSTNHDSLRNIVRKLEKLGYRLACVNLTDAHHITDSSKYIAILLLALRTMLQLSLPHINVLSKIDLLTQYGDLPFNLDFYTEVQDLDYLQYELDKDPRMGKGKFKELNKAICEIVEDFGLVGFTTLCVEDKMSMASLVKQVDQILGCLPTSRSHTHTHDPLAEDDSLDATPYQLLHSLPPSAFPSPADIQEKYVDHKEEHRADEKARWQSEADAFFKRASEDEKRRAIQRAKSRPEDAV